MPTRNEIIFLAGILQAPFFDKDYPKYDQRSGFFSHTDRSIALRFVHRWRYAEPFQTENHVR